MTPPGTTQNAANSGLRVATTFAPTSTQSSRRSPLSLDANTDDLCATNPTGWSCVVQGTTLNGEGYIYTPGTGQTVTCGTAITNITGVTMTTSPTTVSAPPYHCLNAITAPTNATVENNATYTIDSSVSGNCSTNYCGSVVVTGYFEVECSLSNSHCPLIKITDAYAASAPVVSGSPPPQHKTVMGLYAKYVLAQVPGTGTGTYNQPSSVSWNIPGSTYTAYDRSGSAAVGLSAADLGSATPSPFFWADGTQEHKSSVSAQIIRSDSEETAELSSQTDYNVVSPTVSISETAAGATGVRVGTRSDGSPPSFTYLTYGDLASPTVNYSYSVTNNQGFPGSISMTQLISGSSVATGSATPTPTPQIDYIPSATPWLDNAADYASPVPSSSTWSSVDAPGSGCASSTIRRADRERAIRRLFHVHGYPAIKR